MKHAQKSGSSERVRCAVSRKRVLAALALFVTTAPAARAQWDGLDRGAPRVLELVAATNLIVDRWPEAARHYEQLLGNEPDHPWAAWLATRSLLEAGAYERALEVGLEGLPDARTQAVIALELARVAVALEDPENAVGFLEAARDAQLVAPAEMLRKDPRLKSLAREPVLRELIAGAEDVAGRFAALADAQDHEALVMLWHANAAVAWADIPSTTWVLKDVVDDHGRALDRGRDEEAAQLALRLERGARAADEALGIELHRAWIERALAWSDAERRQDASLWKTYKGVGGKIRSHQFARVLETLDELAASATALGDLPARYAIDRTRGLVHSGILNYRQPRKGVSREQEYQAGRAAFLRHLELALQLQDVHGIVDSYDFLATFEVQEPRLSLPDAEQLVFGGIIASARVEPSQRELGMFEGMWRDLQGADR